MIKYIYLQTIAFILCSCQPQSIENNKEEIKNSTTFSYVKIEYIFDKNTQVEETRKKYPIVIINNNTESKQTYTDNPQKYFFEKSNFWSSDTRAFSYIENQQLVKTPTGKSADGSFVYKEEVQWLYSKQEQKRIPNTELSKTIYIKPKHRLSIIPRVTSKVIVTTYKIYFIGKEEGEILTITGRWSGVMFVDYNADYIEEPIVSE